MISWILFVIEFVAFLLLYRVCKRWQKIVEDRNKTIEELREKLYIDKK